MVYRSVFLSVAVLALLWGAANPGQVHAQHGHAGRQSGFRPSFGGFDRGFNRRGFDPRFGGFDHGFDPRFGGFDRGFDRRFFDPRFGGF